MPGAKYHLEPRKVKNPRRYSFIGFDTETKDDGSFLCAAFYGKIHLPRNKTIEISETCASLQEFREKFLEIEAMSKKFKKAFILIGFNAAYDFFYLADIIHSPDNLFSSGRFIQTKTVGGTKVWDLMNHVSGSLESWIEKLDMKRKYGIEKREGYLENDALKREQVLDDAKATWILADWFQDTCLKRFHVGMGVTLQNIALRIYLSRFFNDHWHRHESRQWLNDMERESYYGGRCEVFKRGFHDIQSYDVHGMYVSIMRDKEMPDPTSATLVYDDAKVRELIDAGEILTVACRVRVPKIRIGLLPYRDKTSGKLIFPWGEWEGIYNSVELREALKWGAELVAIRKAVWYPKKVKYFHDYAEWTLEGRRLAKKAGNPAEDLMFKLLGNGLYGKFGQRNKDGGKYVRIEQVADDLIEGHPVYHRDTVDGTHEIWVKLPGKGEEDTWHTFPVIPATITAYARAKLLRVLCQNMDTVVYCDTDSIKTLGEPIGIDTGETPGKWGFEYEGLQDFWAPKFYGNHIKGVPPKREVLTITDDYIDVRYMAPTKPISSIIHGESQNKWKWNYKRVSKRDDKREWLNLVESWPLYRFEELNGSHPIPPQDIVKHPEKSPHQVPVSAMF